MLAGAAPPQRRAVASRRARERHSLGGAAPAPRASTRALSPQTSDCSFAVATVRGLLSHGAQVDAVNQSADDCHVACSASIAHRLHYAAVRTGEGRRRRGNANWRPRGDAVLQDTVPLILALLEGGANPNATDAYGAPMCATLLHSQRRHSLHVRPRPPVIAAAPAPSRHGCLRSLRRC